MRDRKISKTNYNQILDAIEIISDVKGLGLILLYLEQWPVKHKIVKKGLDAMDKHNLKFLCVDKEASKK